MASEIRSLNGYLFKDESARAANELLEARVEALEKDRQHGRRLYRRRQYCRG